MLGLPIKYRFLGSKSQDSDSASLVWDARVFIFNKLSVGLICMQAAYRLHCEKHREKKSCGLIWMNLFYLVLKFWIIYSWLYTKQSWYKPSVVC